MCSKGIHWQVSIDLLTKIDRHLDQHSTNILLDTSTLDQADSWVTCINQKLVDSRLTDSQVSTEVSIRVNRGVTGHLTTMEFRHQPTHHQETISPPSKVYSPPNTNKMLRWISCSNKVLLLVCTQITMSTCWHIFKCSIVKETPKQCTCINVRII